MLEEGVIYTFDQSKQGITNEKLYRFLMLSLDLLSLGFSKHFSEYLPILRDNLSKINYRILKLMTKND